MFMARHVGVASAKGSRLLRLPHEDSLGEDDAGSRSSARSSESGEDSGLFPWATQSPDSVQHWVAPDSALESSAESKTSSLPGADAPQGARMHTDKIDIIRPNKT